MKTLSISDAAKNLASLVKQAIAGEAIGIRSDDAIVALQPLSPGSGKPGSEPLSPREALRRLQQAARLSPAEAENYLRELHAERLASEKRSA